MKRTLPMLIGILCLSLALGLLAGCDESANGGKEGFASPTAAVEAFYRTQQSDDADALLACYPPQIRDYIVEQSGGKREFEKNFEQSTMDPTTVEVYYIDQDTDEMNERCTSAQQAYADKGIEITLEKYVEAYCTLVVNGDESQAQDRAIPCGLIGGQWYVLY